MRIKREQNGAYQVWLSAKDSWGFANQPGNRWVCSETSGRRFRLSFDRKGELMECVIDGRCPGVGIGLDELNALLREVDMECAHCGRNLATL